MIQFLNLNDFKRGKTPVTSTELYSIPGEWHPEGLFSEIIFGVEDTPQRKTTFSYIDLGALVIHPAAYGLLIQLDRKVEKFLSTEESYVLDGNGQLQESPDGVTGISEFINLLPKINFRGGTEVREKFIEKIKKADQDGLLFIDIIPVIPPEQRPAYKDQNGTLIIDPLNDHYMSLIRKSLQIKSSVKSGPLFDLLNYELQKAAISHDEFIRKLIQKKNGLIRSQLLGKRTDFSGRAVITPMPHLKIDEVGVPFRMAISLFEPFIIHRLLYSGKVDHNKLEKLVQSYTDLELSIDSLKAVFKAIRSGDNIPKDVYDFFFRETAVAMMGKYVIIKRDPVLHPESVRGCKPVLVEGNTLQISALTVGGYNADFDGDQMAIFVPITAESQAEIATKMMKPITGDNSKSVAFELSKEMCAGLYTLTKDVQLGNSPIAMSDEDLKNITNPYIPVIYRKQITTAGKALFNSVFPQDFPFMAIPATKKIVNGMIGNMIAKYGMEETYDIYHKLQQIGFKYATIMAPTLSLDNIQLPSSILTLKAKLDSATTEEADVIIKQMEKLLVEHLKNTGFYDLIESGAGKGWTQPMQILVAKGLIADPTGKVLPPIKGSFADGLTNTEYFNAAAGARKGIIDRVLNTASTGYMSRKLAYVLNSVEIDRNLFDCKTDRVLTFRMTKEMEGRFVGRYVVKGGQVKKFDPNEIKIGDIVNLRTPIFCTSQKICHVCYGELLHRHRTPYAGILASQLIGEAGTQTIMKVFHTGGAVKIIKKDIRYDLIQNDPLTTKELINSKFGQNESDLYTKQTFVLTLNMEDYPLTNDLQYNEDGTELNCKALVATAEFEDAVFSMILDYPVTLQVYNQEKIGKEYIKFLYEANSTVLNVPYQTDDTKSQIQYVERLLGGKEIYKDANHLYLKLFSVYGTLRNMDSVHLEILLSQALRDKSNNSIPARLGKTWNPVMTNIKKIVFNTSFMQGLAFENINEAIKTGLISDAGGDPSILEKVLTGTIIQSK